MWHEKRAILTKADDVAGVLCSPPSHGKDGDDRQRKHHPHHPRVADGPVSDRKYQHENSAHGARK